MRNISKPAILCLLLISMNIFASTGGGTSVTEYDEIDPCKNQTMNGQTSESSQEMCQKKAKLLTAINNYKSPDSIPKNLTVDPVGGSFDEDALRNATVNDSGEPS